MARIFWGAHGAVAAGANPSVLLLGDSWLWYPMDNLAIEIGAAYPVADFVVAGRNGAEAGEWKDKYRKEIDYTFDLYASGAQALVLSGGGNDIAGMSDFLRIVADDCSKARSVAECYRTAQPDALVGSIVDACRLVIRKFRAHEGAAKPPARVFMHNYDHAWPTGKGVFGPATWLKVPMDRARVPVRLRRDLLKDLLGRLHDAQSALAADASLGPLVVLRSAGTMPDEAGWWANELHPTPRGFKRLAEQAFIPALGPLA